jgi:hypothetical protein
MTANIDPFIHIYMTGYIVPYITSVYDWLYKPSINLKTPGYTHPSGHAYNTDKIEHCRHANKAGHRNPSGHACNTAYLDHTDHAHYTGDMEPSGHAYNTV